MPFGRMQIMDLPPLPQRPDVSEWATGSQRVAVALLRLPGLDLEFVVAVSVSD